MKSVLKTDYREIIAASDLNYDGVTGRREAGLPLGNGKMGSLLWTTPFSVRFQINRIDVYNNGCATNSFPVIDTDSATGCGFVDIDFVDFGNDVFPETNTKQHLNTYDGFASLKGEEIEVKAFICRDSDVLAIEVTDNRKKPTPIRTTLRVLRFDSQYDKGKRPYQYPGGLNDDAVSIVRTLEHKAVSKLLALDGCTVLTQEFTEKNFYCKSAVAVSVAGRASKIKRDNETEYSISAEPGNGTFTILISSAATFNKSNKLEQETVQLAKSAAGEGFPHLLETHKKWWNGFWNDGSYLKLHSEDGDADYVSYNCNYFMYLMACISCGGSFAPRYGGLLWYSGGDFHMWGAMQWWHNIGCYYQALPSTGRFELMEPLFTQLTNNYKSYARAAEQMWGSKGIWIPETQWFDGLEELPDYIAEEMRELYLMRKRWPERSERFKEFAKNKSPFESSWNWRLGPTYHGQEYDAAPFSYVTHIFSATAKYAYLFWLKYEYTLDLDWLRDRAYPMVKGAADFYANYPNAVREEDGKIHLHHVNNHESNWNCNDSIDEMEAVHGILPIAIRASEILDVDGDLRESWKTFLRDLAPLPLNTHPDAMEPRKPGEPVMFTGALKPVFSRRGGHACTNSPILHFNLITLEMQDKELLEIARNSYLRNFNDHIVDGRVRCWALDHSADAAAKMGDAEAIRQLIPAQIRLSDPEKDFCEFIGVGMPAELANRLTLREGPEAIDAQRLGRACQAVQDALCMGIPVSPGGDPIIRLFAAWPRQWDAEFKLAAPHGFTVTSVMKKGEIEFVEITSQKGRDCTMRNPWLGGKVQLIRNENSTEEIDGEILRFGTAIDETVVLKKLQ